MKIGLTQLNPTVGDFPGNAKRILAGYRECLDLGAELVLTPELSLVGYPPRDLVYKSQFIPKCLQALDYLAGEVGEVPLIVGYIDHNESSAPGRPFRNAAAVLHRGQLVAKVFKTQLPSYDVFDEHRYFEPAEKCEPVEILGYQMGITICEDIWTEEYLMRPLYRRDPLTELKDAGAEMILNLSASPYHYGKPAERESMLAALAERHQMPIYYCNALGGNDQLIFDGHSLAFDSDGRCTARLAGFIEDSKVVETDDHQPAKPLNEWPVAEIHDALVLGLRDYVTKCGFDSVCLGLSGGIDSALTAALAVEALGPDSVHGLTMPSPFSSGGSVDDSFKLAKALGMSCQEVPISEVFEATKASMKPVFDGLPEGIAEENMQARIRGLFLMSFSNKMGHLLLTTGNKSELAVGYCTMYGDMCGGLAVISDLPKMMVYELSRFVNRERELIPWTTIEKPPSAELRPDQKDSDSLPPYEVLDAILELYVSEQMSATDIIEKHDFDETLVRWVQRRVDLNEWKRQQAAPGLRVTSKAFGMGRRIPIVQKFVD